MCRVELNLNCFDFENPNLFDDDDDDLFGIFTEKFTLSNTYGIRNWVMIRNRNIKLSSGEHFKLWTLPKRNILPKRKKFPFQTLKSQPKTNNKSNERTNDQRWMETRMGTFICSFFSLISTKLCSLPVLNSLICNQWWFDEEVRFKFDRKRIWECLRMKDNLLFYSFVAKLR